MKQIKLLVLGGSGEAAALSASAGRKPLQPKGKSIAPWESVYRRLMQYHEAGLTLDEKTPEIAALKQELSRMTIGTHPEFNRLYVEAKRLPDGPERNAIYREMNRLFLVYAPWRLGVHRYYNDLVHPWVLGYYRHPVMRGNWKFLDIDLPKLAAATK